MTDDAAASDPAAALLALAARLHSAPGDERGWLLGLGLMGVAGVRGQVTAP